MAVRRRDRRRTAGRVSTWHRLAPRPARRRSPAPATASSTTSAMSRRTIGSREIGRACGSGDLRQRARGRVRRAPGRAAGRSAGPAAGAVRRSSRSSWPSRQCARCGPDAAPGAPPRAVRSGAAPTSASRSPLTSKKSTGAAGGAPLLAERVAVGEPADAAAAGRSPVPRAGSSGRSRTRARARRAARGWSAAPRSGRPASVVRITSRWLAIGFSTAIGARRRRVRDRAPLRRRERRS